MKRKAGKIAVYLFAVIILILTVFPIVYSFLASFKTNQELMTGGTNIFPSEWRFDNYTQAWKIANFGQYTWNSLYMTFAIMIGALIVTAMAGYSFARGRFPGQKLMFGILTATMFISLGSITMYPLLQITTAMNLKGLNGIILVKIFALHIVDTYLVKGYVEGLPLELNEAAKIDGCSFFKTFTMVMLPIMKPILATVAILTFRASWNDYLLPSIFTLGFPKQIPLSVGIVKLKSTGEAVGSWNLMMAGTMISVIPMMIVYLFLNKYFVAGITSGAVKG